jgi:hypothetical protein
MRRTAPALLILLALAGCSTEPPAPTIPAGPPPSTSAAPTTPPSSFGSQESNARGNLVKALGQPAAMTASTANGDVRTVEFRVDAIRQRERCAAEGYTDEPTNGQFLAVDVYASTTPEFDPTRDDTGFLGGGYAWTVVTADGVRHTVDTAEAYSCSPRSRENLNGLTAAVTVSGTVLLDAPADLAGAVLVLRPGAADGGWEWAIPAA